MKFYEAIPPTQQQIILYLVHLHPGETACQYSARLLKKYPDPYCHKHKRGTVLHELQRFAARGIVRRRKAPGQRRSVPAWHFWLKKKLGSLGLRVQRGKLVYFREVKN